MRFWKELPLMITPIFAARKAVDFTLDIVFPPQSLLTGAPSTGRGIESELWDEVQFLDDPCCSACGFPFEYDMSAGGAEPVLCARCTARRPRYDSARAAMAYDDVSRKLVLDFKHGGRTAGLRVFAVHMARAGRESLSRADMIIPVPLHRKRLLRRRYNQSALLARALADHSSARFDADSLKRVRDTQTQGGKTASGRRRNVMAAFAVREKAKAGLKGKTVVLIDDVFTTGATLEACARALKGSGAARVDALCLARVVKPQDVPT